MKIVAKLDERYRSPHYLHYTFGSPSSILSGGLYINKRKVRVQSIEIELEDRKDGTAKV